MGDDENETDKVTRSGTLAGWCSFTCIYITRVHAIMFCADIVRRSQLITRLH